MQKELAQRLLSATLNWSSEDIEKYRNLIENFAELKYDEYQQYKPGSRFIENLCVWLNQFEEGAERETALKFILEKLVFVSTSEIQHLIDMVYPLLVAPVFEQQSDNIIGAGKELSDKKSEIIEMIKTSSIFLAMSDGARIDVFRRFANLEHNQICLDYDLSDTKFDEIVKEMKKRTKAIAENASISAPEIICGYDQVSNIFLLDDFSGSGISYLRKEESNEWKGKIQKVLKRLEEEEIIKDNTTKIHIILYLITEQALNALKKNIQLYCLDKDFDIDISYVQKVNKVELSDAEETLFKKYYSPQIEDSHYKKGNTENPYHGFDGCSLSIVIYHNTPNNSFPILWEGDNALFPRVIRHKDVRN